MEARPARGASSPPFLFRRLFAGPQRRLRWPTPFLPRSQFSGRRFLPAPKRCGLLHPLRAFWIRLCGFCPSHLTAEILSPYACNTPIDSSKARLHGFLSPIINHVSDVLPDSARITVIYSPRRLEASNL